MPYHPQVSICPGCDLLLESIEPAAGQAVVCPRCGHRLHRYKTNAVQKALALSLTGLLLYLPANFMPLLTFDVLGINSSASIFTSSLSMLAQGQYVVGAIVVLTGLLFPLTILFLLFWVSLGLHLGRRASWMPSFFRSYQELTEWAMTDVYLIGVFITIIKMNHMAEIEFNTGFFCFIGLVVSIIGSQTVIDHPLFWSHMDRESDSTDRRQTTSSFPADLQTAKQAGLVLCHSCHKVLTMIPDQEHTEQRCPRCGARLHCRKPDSINRSWALVLTALILTVPANLLPIMEVNYFGVPDRSTIMDGIIYFFQEGSIGIGMIILTASILVPMFKILGMAVILLSIRFRLQNWLRHKAVMFRFIEFIGRWSMLDIFVIALLCALVKFGYFSTINIAPAAFYFTGVVLSTMLAAISFDPRLLWDAGAPFSTEEHINGTTGSP